MPQEMSCCSGTSKSARDCTFALYAISYGRWFSPLLSHAQRYDLAFVRKLMTREEPTGESALDTDVRREARRLRPMHGVDVIERPLALLHCPVIDIKESDEVSIDANPSAPSGDLVAGERPGS